MPRASSCIAVRAGSEVREAGARSKLQNSLSHHKCPAVPRCGGVRLHFVDKRAAEPGVDLVDQDYTCVAVGFASGAMWAASPRLPNKAWHLGKTAASSFFEALSGSDAVLEGPKGMNSAVIDQQPQTRHHCECCRA